MKIGNRIEETFESAYAGERIHVLHCRPDGPEIGTVLLLHGLGDHIGKHEWAIRLFVERGFAVVGFDWPGCGRSSGIRGHLPDFATIGDLIEEVLDRFSARPVGVYAHSTGAYLVHRFFSRGPAILDGVSWVWFSSPLLHPEHGQGALKVAFASAVARVLPRLTLPTGVHPSDCYHVPAGEDPEHFHGLSHGRVSVGFGKRLIESGPITRERGFPGRLAFLLTAGSDDPVCPPLLALEFFRDLPNRDKALIYVKNRLHEPFREAHPIALLSGARAWLRTRAETIAT